MFTSICYLGIEHLYLCTMQIVDSHMHALRSTEWHQCTEKAFGILLKERNSIASHAVSSLWALAIHKVEALVFGDYDCQSFIPPSQHNTSLVGGWTNPFENMLKKIGSFPKKQTNKQSLSCHPPRKKQWCMCLTARLLVAQFQASIWWSPTSRTTKPWDTWSIDDSSRNMATATKHSCSTAYPKSFTF